MKPPKTRFNLTIVLIFVMSSLPNTEISCRLQEAAHTMVRSPLA